MEFGAMTFPYRVLAFIKVHRRHVLSGQVSIGNRMVKTVPFRNSLETAMDPW
jgi:hypothetical protein